MTNDYKMLFTAYSTQKIRYKDTDNLSDGPVRRVLLEMASLSHRMKISRFWNRLHNKDILCWFSACGGFILIAILFFSGGSISFISKEINL